MRYETLLHSFRFSEKLYFTVKEVAQGLKSLIDKNFTALWIEGEISNLRYSQNGNVYFTLVEEDASIKAMIFSSDRTQDTKLILKDGLRVLCFGRLNFYTRSGDCFFIVRKIEPLGKGILALKKEELIKKYKPLFDPNRKKALPPYPRKIALITSIFGAALKDFLKTSYKRWNLEVLVYPVRVQGEGAEKEIAQAIEDINNYFKDVEVIIITRGGGSIEDLAPFYTEEIILSVRDSKIPVVSAVGHEIDYTICDLIADKRCPTPTAAAEEVLPDKKELIERLETYKKKYYHLLEIAISKRENTLYQLKLAVENKNPFKLLHDLEKRLKDQAHQLTLKMERLLSFKEGNLIELKHRIKKKHPQQKIILEEEKLRFLKNRLNFAITNILEKKKERIGGLQKLLNSLSPLNILQRGYSIVRLYPQGKIVKLAEELQEGQTIEAIFSKGRALAEVKKVEI